MAEFRLRRRFSALPSVSELPPVCGENANRILCALRTKPASLTEVASKKNSTHSVGAVFLEATPGIEPGNQSFADSCLTAWLCRRKNWSGRRGSNSLPPPWQGGALPDELRPHMRGLLSARSNCGAQGRNRTSDTGIFSPLLYLLSYLGI